MEEVELKTAESEEIRAAKSAAITNPEIPGGNKLVRSIGYAISGSSASFSGQRPLAISPGNTKRNTGSIFSSAVRFPHALA